MKYVIEECGGATTHRCAEEGGTCRCTGDVEYTSWGDGVRPGRRTNVDGDVACATGTLGPDPAPGKGKHCTCTRPHVVWTVDIDMDHLDRSSLVLWYNVCADGAPVARLQKFRTAATGPRVLNPLPAGSAPAAVAAGVDGPSGGTPAPPGATSAPGPAGDGPTPNPDEEQGHADEDTGSWLRRRFNVTIPSGAVPPYVYAFAAYGRLGDAPPDLAAIWDRAVGSSAGGFWGGMLGGPAAGATHVLR